MDTRMSFEDYAELVQAVKDVGCITMSTPFDEKSVDTCIELGVEIIKIASSDINDWVLIEKIAGTRKPVIVSTGGSSLKDVDDMVAFFTKRQIPLAVNHCVSIYLSEKYELELNQIDFLKNRYPDLVVGFSTHEYNADIEDAMLIAYAKGSRTFERHVDLDYDGIQLSPYNSLPSDFDRWVKAWRKAKEICGAPSTQKRVPPKKEIEYLDALVRGVYAKRDLKAGEVLTAEDIYLAIPLQKGQISCRELMNGEVLKNNIDKDAVIHIDDIDAIYENLPIERVQETLQVNLLAFYAILQYLIPFFKEKGGHIVAISSLYGTIARSGRAAYVMSKHALNGLVQAAAIELGKYGVKINTVSPGFVDTKMTRKNNDPEKIEFLKSKIALGSLSRPSDIADIVYYLCSDQNNYITGQDIVIDGGFMAGSFQ